MNCPDCGLLSYVVCTWKPDYGKRIRYRCPKDHKFTVLVVIKQELKRGAKKWPDAVVAQVRTLHQNGMKPKDLACEFGVPLDTIKDWVNYRSRFTRNQRRAYLKRKREHEPTKLL